MATAHTRSTDHMVQVNVLVEHMASKFVSMHSGRRIIFVMTLFRVWQTDLSLNVNMSMPLPFCPGFSFKRRHHDCLAFSSQQSFDRDEFVKLVNGMDGNFQSLNIPKVAPDGIFGQLNCRCHAVGLHSCSFSV